MADPTPRKSSFGKGDNSITANHLTLAQTASAAEKPTEAPTQEKARKAAPKAAEKRSQPEAEAKEPTVRMGAYMGASDAARIREAFKRNQFDEGYETISDFIVRAAMAEVKRLEKKYNDGKPYEGIGKLKPGRAPRF